MQSDSDTETDTVPETAPTFTIVPRGPFSLKESVEFGFGQRDAAPYRGVMRLAFCLDDFGGQAGVLLTQDAEGVHGWVKGTDDVSQAERQTARVLSLDTDVTDFLMVGRRDPVIGRLQELAPGLRPPLFYSPYEAAAWSVLSARRPHKQMAALREALNVAHGREFELGGGSLAAFPTPQQLLAVTEFPGLQQLKIDRLHDVARAALDGQLNPDRLLALDPDDAMRDLQSIPGIGPFYSSLIVIRAVGVHDVLPRSEPRAMEAARVLYGLDAPPTDAELAAIAETWRPWRTWATVYMRAAGSRAGTAAA